MDKTLTGKKIVALKEPQLVKWQKNFTRLQERFFAEPIRIRRVQEISDFIQLNDYRKVYQIGQVDLDMPTHIMRESFNDVDLIVVTDQRFSRLPVHQMIWLIRSLTFYSDLYVCLNRHYLNIENAKIKTEYLPEDYQVAVRNWLCDQLRDGIRVIDLSRKHEEHGNSFTFAIPDLQFFFTR